jgi:hypothetical protein
MMIASFGFGAIMELAFKKAFGFLPLIWGFVFVAPLTAQVIQYFDWSSPMGLLPLTTGFIVGGLWGLYAQIRGTWFW